VALSYRLNDWGGNYGRFGFVRYTKCAETEIRADCMMPCRNFPASPWRTQTRTSRSSLPRSRCTIVPH